MSQPASRSDAPTRADVRTFLITDVRGYSRYTLEYGDEAAAKLAQEFAAIARDVVTSGGGEVLEVRGDEVLCVFGSTRHALLAALQLQQRYGEEDAGAFRVGIGLDAGEAVPVENGYRGAAVNLAARLCSLAGAGEILASDAVAHLARKVEGLAYAERGYAQLKGFSDPVRVIEVLSAQDSPGAGPEAHAARAEHRIPIGGFLGSLPSGVLVGRDHEMAQILERVEVVAGGTGQLVLLAGEPGVGKTRLAQELTLQLRTRDFLLAAGRCYEPQQTSAFYPFLEALTALLEAAPAGIKAGAPTLWPYLGQLLPDQIPVHPVASESADDQQLLFRAVTGLVQEIADEQPVALLLDDLHWADAASLELLQHLARQTRADRVLLFGTYRDVEVNRQHPLEAALRDLRREALIETIDIRRLDEAETSALMAATMGEEEISDEFSELVYGRTEGNPFFVQQVMRALVEQGDVYREGDRWGRRAVIEIEVPESIRSVVGQRLSRLSEETQEILREASVLGQTFSFDDLEVMSERPERELERSLEEASRAGMIREVGNDAYGFDHALTQQSLYGELSSRRRRRLHLSAGEAIEKTPAGKREARAGELAWHFLQAGEPARALIWSMRAGDQAELVFAHREAELQYRTALELARDTGDMSAEAEALRKLGKVLQIVARYDEALEVLQEAVALHRRHGDREAEAQLLELVGATHAIRGTPQDGIARVRSLLSEVEAEGALSTRRLAGLYVALSHLYLVGGRGPELLQVAESAVRLAEAAGDSSLLAEAEDRHGVALMDRGRFDEARIAHERAMALAEQEGNLRTVGRAANNLAVHYLMARADLHKNLEYRQRALAAAERHGDLGPLTFMISAVSQAWFWLGNWEEARRYGERGLALARSLGSSWSSSYALMSLGHVLIWQGDEATGRSLILEGLELAWETGDIQGLFVGNHYLGAFAMVRGRPQDVVDRWLPVLKRAEGNQRPLWQSGPPSLAWAYIALGQHDRAA